MRLLVLLLTLPALAVAGCSVGDDGPRTTQTRDVDNFTRIEAPSSVDVRVHVGERQHLEVRAGEKVISDVRTEVRDGTLKVEFDHDGFGGDNVIVEASVPKLTGVESSGSGNVDADGIDADAFEVTVDGSGDVKLAGTVARLTVEVDGSGNAELADLTAREARVVADGSGDAEVRAADQLEVHVDGSGDVLYHGDPELNFQDDGSGDLSQAA